VVNDPDAMWKPGFVDGVDLIVVDAVTGDRLAGAGAAPSTTSTRSP